MKKWRKIGWICLLVVVIGGPVAGYAGYRQLKREIPDYYAQWAAAEMVIWFREDHHRMPGNWDELKPYCGPGNPHRGRQSFEEIRQRIIIDFPRLPELESDHSNRSIPKIVQTTSGVQRSWSVAEPNELIHFNVWK